MIVNRIKSHILLFLQHKMASSTNETDTNHAPTTATTNNESAEEGLNLDNVDAAELAAKHQEQEEQLNEELKDIESRKAVAMEEYKRLQVSVAIFLCSRETALSLANMV